jgi:hypothetical protein
MTLFTLSPFGNSLEGLEASLEARKARQEQEKSPIVATVTLFGNNRTDEVLPRV